MTTAQELRFSLLTEPLVRYRRERDGGTVFASLPQLLVALAGDEVRDYPALRPHQRHPWHAFLVQLAAIALHKAGRAVAFETCDEWCNALLALTPDDKDGAAWCLVSPPNRPAFLQAAVANGSVVEWTSEAFAADAIDMLVTSKNHDIKAGRAYRSQPEDWLFALLSLQTQEGFLGAGNYGVSRMNGGFASKPGVGVAAVGLHGARWTRDINALLTQRKRTVQERGLQGEDGVALVWLVPWDGVSSLSFAKLDPFYIEICRRIRLQVSNETITSIGTGSKTPRIMAKELSGLTGDAWTPIDVEGAKALTITANGFDYKLVAALLFDGKFQPPAAHHLTQSKTENDLVFIAQGVTRGQGKTEGYHERRVPISPRVRGMLINNQKAPLGRLSTQRIATIGEVRKLLWVALAVLFSSGRSVDSSDGNKAKASKFSEPFETAENARFFDDLNDELAAEDPAAQRLEWMLGLVGRAEAILKTAFDAGPRNCVQKYRAQSAALSRFHGGLRGDKSPLPDLVAYYRQQDMKRQEQTVNTFDTAPHEPVALEHAAAYREPLTPLAAYILSAGSGERAALARMQPEALQPHQLAALARALLAAGLSPDQWHADTWPRWAMIAHGMALAGHDGKQKLGKQLAQAGVSESRVTKLLTSRGDAFVQLLPRVLRLLASKRVAPNWRELGELVLIEGSGQPHHQTEAEEIRLHIAGSYFSALARAPAKS